MGTRRLNLVFDIPVTEMDRVDEYIKKKVEFADSRSGGEHVPKDAVVLEQHDLRTLGKNVRIVWPLDVDTAHKEMLSIFEGIVVRRLSELY